MQKIVRFSRLVVISTIFVSIFTACDGGVFTRDKEPTEADVLLGQKGRTLWESKLQYVKIVDQDVTTLANEHPETISAEEMRIVLGSLSVIKKGIFKSTEEPLFTRRELQILGAALSSGLSQATSNEDITFVSIDKHKGAITQEDKTITGRVFMSNGRLNIIFGLLHEIYREFDVATGQAIDRRLHPLIPGKRTFDSKPDIRVVLNSGQANYFDPDTGTERNNWIVIDIATVLAAAAERSKADTGSVTPELLEDIARSKQSTNTLRHDIGKMKEIIFEMSDEIERLKSEIDDLKMTAKLKTSE